MMIHIVIDGAVYPAQIFGIYRSYQEALDKHVHELENDPLVDIISWDIINNNRVDFTSSDGGDDGGTPVMANVA